MNNHYSLKDKRLSIWSFTSTTSHGVPVKTYNKEYSLIWTYYRHNGGSAAITGSSLKFYDENGEALFVINKRKVDIGWLVIYNHKIYEIKRIDDYEGYNDDIKLYCKMATNQSFSAYNGLVDD